jgi:iron complex outermembrane receptor protein
MKLPLLKTTAAGFLSLLPLAAVAETQLEREEIVVTSTRSQYSANTPAMVTTIDRAEIERSAARSLVDVLRNQGALTITDFFGDGSRPTIAIRGFGENGGQHALVLVDGRRLNNFDIAAPDLNSIPLKDVERIEIIEGSAATLYGDQAVGGVINIITRRASANNTRASITLGTDRASEVDLSVRQKLSENWGLSANINRRDVGNYRQNNDLRYSNISVGLDRRKGDHSQVYELQYVDEYLQTPGPLFAAELAADRRQSTANFSDDYSDTQTQAVRLGFYGALSANWDYEVDVTGRETDGEFLLSFASFKNTDPATQDRAVWSVSPRLVGYLPSSHGDVLWVSGIDYQDSRYDLSSSIGIQRSRQNVASVYSRVQQPLAAEVELTYGLRYARSENELTDSFKYLTPTEVNDNLWGGELGLRKTLSSRTELLARVERVYRFAKVDEHTNTAFGVTASLEPTEGYSYELGVEQAYNKADLRFSLWQIDLENEIAFDPTVFANINLEDTRRIGFTAFVGVDLSEASRVSLSGSVVEAESRRGALKGKSVPLVPRYNVRIGLNQDWGSRWTSLLEWQAVGKRAFSGDFSNNFDRLDDYNVVNLALRWQAVEHSVSLRVNNVLNEKYSEFGAVGFNSVGVREESFLPSPETTANVNWEYSF